MTTKDGKNVTPVIRPTVSAPMKRSKSKIKKT